MYITILLLFYFHVRVILLIYEWITSKNTVKNFFMSWLRFRSRKVFYDCCSSPDGQRGPSETCKVFCSSCRCYNWRELRIQCHLFCFAMWLASEREIFLEDHISLNFIIGQPLWKNIPFQEFPTSPVNPSVITFTEQVGAFEEYCFYFPHITCSLHMPLLFCGHRLPNMTHYKIYAVTREKWTNIKERNNPK